MAEERPLISAVFHNRLARECASRAIRRRSTDLDHTGPVRKADLERPSPYNTYQIQGLPPAGSRIQAAPRSRQRSGPAPGVHALYFVSRNDRTHEFNTESLGRPRAGRQPPPAGALADGATPQHSRGIVSRCVCRLAPASPTLRLRDRPHHGADRSRWNLDGGLMR